MEQLKALKKQADLIESERESMAQNIEPMVKEEDKLKLKVYIAGSFTEKDKMKTLIQQFQDRGYNITHDWTKSEVDTVSTRSREDNQLCAERDINGVKEADALVAIIDNPKYSYRGVSCELGCALGLGIPVFLCHSVENSYWASNVFHYHPGISHCKDIAGVWKQLEGFEPLVNRDQLKSIASVSDVLFKKQRLNQVMRAMRKRSMMGHYYLKVLWEGEFPYREDFEKAGYTVSTFQAPDDEREKEEGTDVRRVMIIWS